VSGRQVLFAVGLLIYALSFIMIATGDHGRPTGELNGLLCAYLPFEITFQDTPFSPKSASYDPPLLYFSILISGLINPVFLFYVALSSLKRMQRTARVLRFVVPAMIPFCWIVFHFLKVYPREGHIVWVVGMLLVIFSSRKNIPRQVA
jgi:hypothetical protein